MQTKKYTAATLKEATEKMKTELGSEAMILSTRIIEQPKNGTIQKLFEVVAGYEEEIKQLNKIQKITKNAESRPKPALKASTDLEARKSAAKKILSNGLFNEKKNVDDLKKEIQTVVEVLREKDVKDDVIKMVIDYLKKSEKFLSVNNLDDYVITGLASLIKTKNFSVEKRKTGKVVSIIGPTGVGKTTCIAKLAAISKIIHNLDIGIISIDTYRLGAIDQLRIFSEISNVDMLVAYEPEDMPKLIDKLKKKDLIFIDTTGRSQRNIGELQKMKEFLSQIKIDETYLALSLSSSSKNLIDAADKFSMFNYDSFIFTKVDEAVTHGNMVNLSVRTQKPVIYLTNGQIIPDDILSADPEYAATLIYNGHN
ncbi:MAG: hypothetical protein C4543_00790 [Ignavibacteriales bacterium]|nr:MAG: hypothetical protein C4543_00790 [Ignavibacteriales bacterium]